MHTDNLVTVEVATTPDAVTITSATIPAKRHPREFGVGALADRAFETMERLNVDCVTLGRTPQSWAQTMTRRAVKMGFPVKVVTRNNRVDVNPDGSKRTSVEVFVVRA